MPPIIPDATVPARSTVRHPAGRSALLSHSSRQGTNMMSEQILKEGPRLPTDDRALARLRRAIELGELEQLPTVLGIPNTPRLPGHLHEFTDRGQRHAFGHGYIGDQSE